MFVHWVRDCSWYLSSGWIKLGLVLAQLWSSFISAVIIIFCKLRYSDSGMWYSVKIPVVLKKEEWIGWQRPPKGHPVIFPTTKVSITAYWSKVQWCICMPLPWWTFLIFFFFQVTLTWGNFLHLAAGEISLANLFISWGRGLLVYPYCNVNIVSYTLFTCGGKYKWILKVYNHLLHRLLGTLSVLSPLREEWWLLGGRGE